MSAVCHELSCTEEEASHSGCNQHMLLHKRGTARCCSLFAAVLTH